MDNAKGLLRLSGVQEVFPQCRSQIYKMVKEGRFPRPVKVGRSVFWKKADVYDFVDRVIADAEQGNPDVR